MYLAHDDDLDRPVALKLLGGNVAVDEDTRDRFLREAKTVAALDHPNIVNIYARGETDDQLWIAMQFVAGTDASQPIRTGLPMPPQRAVRIISETAAALDFAHARGVLHRDVKPANILLAGDTDRVLLADFGIAKALDDKGIRTSTGLVVASLQYAAPEQLDPSVQLDGRIDVYALGATLYHLLTGLPPYTGTMAQIVNSHLNAPIPMPSEYGAPATFDAVIARAMAKDRDDRYRTCGELAAAAQHALATAPAPTSRPAAVFDGPTRVQSVRPTDPPTRVQPTNPPTWVQQQPANPPTRIEPSPRYDSAPVARHGSYVAPGPPPNRHQPADSRPSRRWLILAGVAVVVVAGGIGGFFLLQQDDSNIAASTGGPDRGAASSDSLPFPDRTDCQPADSKYVDQIDLSFDDTSYSLADAFQAEGSSGVVYIAGSAEHSDSSMNTIGVWLYKDGSYYTLPGDAGTLTPGFVDGSGVLNASLDDAEARSAIECNANAMWQHGR